MKVLGINEGLGILKFSLVFISYLKNSVNRKVHFCSTTIFSVVYESQRVEVAVTHQP